MRVRLLRQGQQVHEEQYPLPFAGPVLAGPILSEGPVDIACCLDPDDDDDGISTKSGSGSGPRASHQVRMNSVRNIKALAAGGGETDVQADQIVVEFLYSEESDCPCSVDEVGVYASGISSLTIDDEALRFGDAEVRVENFHVTQSFGPTQGSRRLSASGSDGAMSLDVGSVGTALLFPLSEFDPPLQPGGILAVQADRPIDDG